MFPPPPVPMPPKQKPKPTNPQAAQVGDVAQIDADPFALSGDEAEVGSLFSVEEMSPDDTLPPLIDWHLPGLAAAEYIDPFTVPAAHMLKQGMKIDIASMMEAARLGEQQSAIADSTRAQDIASSGGDVNHHT